MTTIVFLSGALILQWEGLGDIAYGSLLLVFLASYVGRVCKLKLD